MVDLQHRVGAQRQAVSFVELRVFQCGFKTILFLAYEMEN